jgi:hypothetical protein
MALTTTASDPETSSSRRKAFGAKKYWWAGGIAVPLLVAVIGVIPAFLGGSSGDTFINNSRIGGDLYFTTNVEIADPAARSQFEQAIAFARDGLFAEAKALFERIAPTVEAAGVYNNLAVVNAALGDDIAAQRHVRQALQIDPANEAARHNLALISRAVQDQRSNSTILTASPITIGRSLDSRLTARDDNDYFAFTAPAGTRDILRVAVDNKTATFAPSLRLFDAARAELNRTYQHTAGGQLHMEFVASPGATYYVEVAVSNGDAGDYALSVTPLRAFDRFEPNDDILHPAEIQAGQAIEAGIMDDRDSDVYRLAVKPGPVRVVVTNRSAALAPEVVLFDENKSEVARHFNGTAGGNVTLEWQVPRAGTWFVRAGNVSGTSGEYTLRVEQ